MNIIFIHVQKYFVRLKFLGLQLLQEGMWTARICSVGGILFYLATEFEFKVTSEWLIGRDTDHGNTWVNTTIMRLYQLTKMKLS